MTDFALDFVVDYFARAQGGHTKLLNIQRPGRIRMVGNRRVRGVIGPVPGIVGSHYPVPGRDQVFENEGSMRAGDEIVFAKGAQLFIATEDEQTPGDQLWALEKEVGTVRVTDNADGLYRLTILAITYSFTAVSASITAIRDGLLAAIGTPGTFTAVVSGANGILLVGATAGVDLAVIPEPKTLIYQQTKYRNDRFELYKAERWVYGQFTKYGAKLMRSQAGV